MPGAPNYEALEQDLLDALTHLYDPDYEPSQRLYTLTGCHSGEGSIPVQSVVLQALELLKPAPDVPAGARARQIYDVMLHRYALKVTQEEAAETLGMSVRSLHRAQREGVHMLARVLWEHAQATSGRFPPPGTPGSESPQSGAAQAADWHSQVQEELALLHRTAPGAAAPVEETISEVLELADIIASVHGVELQLGFVQPGLVTRTHPAVLRQVLITAIARLAQYVRGPVTIYAGLEDGQAKITLTGALSRDHPILSDEPVPDILIPEGGTEEWHVEEDNIFLWIRSPVGDQSKVLVVDDNPDVVHFYRRCTVGTSYRIIHAPGDREIISTIQAASPDVIVLDIMLPDVDGWKLLMQLHEHPDTGRIPIIVCSVVRERELALALGAVDFLPKPVPPQRFAEALDRALDRSATAWTKAPESNPRAD